MSDDQFSEDEMTLDPPGSIAIIGAGPLGLEAALYGRYLGYEVQVFEQGRIGESFLEMLDRPLPMLPDRCLSPLAVAALKAQDGGVAFSGDPTFPLTIGQWVQEGITRIASSDLLKDRVHELTRVSSIELSPLEPEVDVDSSSNEESYVDGDVPPDYRLTLQSETSVRQQDFEAVILAIGLSDLASITGLSQITDRPYLFRIGDHGDCSDEERLHLGWHQIVTIFARLGGRPSLDLYRPIRS